MTNILKSSKFAAACKILSAQWRLAAACTLGSFETERVTEEDEDGLSGYRNGEELKETQAKGTA